MTLSLGKFALVIATAGGLSVAALWPSPVEAGVMHPSLGLAAASGGSDIVRVRCDRRLSISGAAMTRYEFRGAVTCEAWTVTPPTHTRAITPIKPRGTARAAATAPPIRGPAEDKAGLVSFRSTARSHQPVSTRRSVMHMSVESLLIILLIGAIAGWLAGQIVQGTGFGLVGDIIIGIVGAFIASWLFPQLGIHLGAGIVAAIIAATIGAVLLLVIVRLVRRGGRW